MSSIDIARLNQALQAALSSNPDDRDSILAEACAGDEALEAVARRLISEETEDTAFFQTGGALDAVTESGSADFEDLEGEVVDNYLLLRRIGSGGFGDVYAAQQLAPVRRQVAFKILKAGMDTRAVLARFDAERQALARMEHSNVAKIFDAGATARGRPYFVMEFVDGECITDYCDRLKLRTKGRLKLFLSVCQAVQHAHQKGVIHRDLKPSNILISTAEPAPAPKVIDFGIAKATADDDDATRYTRHGELIGTPVYMSPEQAGLGDRDVDTRADVYSLGVVLYRLLTGVLPVDPAALKKMSPLERLKHLQTYDAPKPSSRVSPRDVSSETRAGRRGVDARILRREVRGDLDWIVLRALEKDPDRRYAAVAEMADDIARYLRHEPVSAGPPSATYRFSKFARRNKVALTVASAFVATLIAALIFSNLQRIEAESAREDLEAVTEFQANMLQSLDAADMGRSLYADLQSSIENAGRAKGTPELVIGDRLDALAVALTDISMTDTARRSIHNHVLLPALDALDERFGAEPLIETRLRMTIGHLYMGLAMYDEAREQFARALELRVSSLGSNHIDTLEVRRKLASIERRSGNLQTAEREFRQILDELTEQVGPTNEQRLRAAHSLSTTLRDLGRYDEAEPLAQSVYENTRDASTSDDLSISAVVALGYQRRRQGRNAEAESIYREGLSRSRTALGNDHPTTLTLLNNLATTHQAQGEYEKAEPLLREALEIKRQTHGNESPTTLLAMGNLARLLLRLNQVAEAEALVHEQIDHSLRAFGVDHAESVYAQGTLAHVAWAHGDFRRGIELTDEDVRTYGRVLGAQHPETLWKRQELGEFQLHVGDAAAAETTLRAALDASGEALGHDHLDTLSAMERLGAVLVERSRWAEAESLLDQAWRESITRLGDSHPLTLRRAARLGDVHTRAGRLQEARALIEPAFEALDSLVPRSHVARMDAALRLSRLRVAQGNYERAERLLLDAWSDGVDAGKGGMGYRKSVAELLVRVYEQSDRAEEWARWQSRYAELQRSTSMS